MEHLLSKQFSEKLKSLVEDNKSLTYKGISKALGYKTDNSITNQLNGTTPPAWERTCDLIEYLKDFGISANMLLDSDTVALHTENSKQHQKLKDEFNKLNNKYSKLVERVNRYEKLFKTCENLTERQLDTLETLMSQSLFKDVLNRVRLYATRYQCENEMLRNKYFFTPYHFYNQAKLDALLQQTIYFLRTKFISDKQSVTKEEWSKNRKDYLDESAIKYSKVDGRSSESDKFMKNYTSNLKDETCMYSYDYINSNFPNLNNDLFRLDEGEICDLKPYSRKNEDTFAESPLADEELDEEFKLVALIEDDLEQQYIEALEKEEFERINGKDIF